MSTLQAALPLLVGVLLAPPCAADERPSGTRIDLEGATLFLPDGFAPQDGRVDLLLHLHGAEAVAERELLESGVRAVLVTFNRKGLSSVYEAPFSDPSLLPRIVDHAMGEVRRKLDDADLTEGRLIVSTFSAGFGGLRAMLREEAAFDRIDAVVLADSLYCGYREDRGELGLDPTKMAGFRRFAREAAAGRKAMLVAHSAQVPEGYGSTTETANDLIRTARAEPEAVRQDWGDGWSLNRRASTGKFLVLGFDGAGPEDHMRHLRSIGKLWHTLPPN